MNDYKDLIRFLTEIGLVAMCNLSPVAKMDMEEISVYGQIRVHLR